MCSKFRVDDVTGSVAMATRKRQKCTLFRVWPLGVTFIFMFEILIQCSQKIREDSLKVS